MSAKVIRFLTLSTMFVQICISYSSFAEMIKVSGPMLPDAMDIVEEVKVENPQTHTSTPTAQEKPVFVNEVRKNESQTLLSLDPVCRGTSTAGQWYRQCDVISNFAPLSDMIENIRCEHFYFSRFAFSDLNASVSRRNASVLALSMARNPQKPISITQQENFQNIKRDVKSPMFPWTQPIVESDIERNIVTTHRNIYEPARPVTRSEAFSLLMASVCMYPKAGADINWQKNIYDVARQNGLTVQSWNQFSPDKNISVGELVILTTRVANWAEKTGGCSIKPTQCVR